MTNPEMNVRKAPESWQIAAPGASFTLSRTYGPSDAVSMEHAQQGYRWGEHGAEVCPVEDAALVRLHERAEPGHSPDFDGLGLAAAQQVLEAAHKAPVHRVEAQRERFDIQKFMDSIGC